MLAAQDADDARARVEAHQGPCHYSRQRPQRHHVPRPRQPRVLRMHLGYLSQVLERHAFEEMCTDGSSTVLLTNVWGFYTVERNLCRRVRACLEGCSKGCLGADVGVGHHEHDGGAHEHVQDCDHSQGTQQTIWQVLLGIHHLQEQAYRFTAPQSIQHLESFLLPM